MTWEDCAEQPPGVWYRVFETDLKVRRLYAELTNVYSITIPLTNSRAFYTLEVTNGKQSILATKDCND